MANNLRNRNETPAKIFMLTFQQYFTIQLNGEKHVAPFIRANRKKNDEKITNRKIGN